MVDRTAFRDYTPDIEMIRRLHRFAVAVDAVELAARPALAMSKLLGLSRAETALSAFEALDNWSGRLNRIAVAAWRLRYGAESFHHSHAVRALAKTGEFIGSLDESHTRLHYHSVFGVPVACEPYDSSDVFYSPASPAEIFARARGIGSRWRVDGDGGLRVDDATVPSVIATKTREVINRVRAFDWSCRAWVLWGPPRGGKSVAARQIAEAIAGGWVRVCGAASTSAQVWEDPPWLDRRRYSPGGHAQPGDGRESCARAVRVAWRSPCAWTSCR